MEETRFDALLRKAARQTTRRASLGVLLGGALQLTNLDESEATKKAKRRKKRNRQRRRRLARVDLKRIRVTVQNPGPDLNVQFVSLEQDWFGALWRCHNAQTKLIPTNREATFITSTGLSDGFVWINGTYSIEFWNPILRKPVVSAAVNGVSMNNRKNCPARGTRALTDTWIPEEMSFDFKIYDKEFTVFRGPDTEYKEYTLTLPATL